MMHQTVGGLKRLLLIISGSVAAYKGLECIRQLQSHHIDVTCILTDGGAQFITPLSVASLSGNPCYTDLFSLTDETEMGHIRLAREADAILVAPASANILANMAHGQATDLATTALLASDAPVFVAPAMNPHMWSNPATQRNIAQLQNDGIHLIEPETGDAACGEYGTGRMAEPEQIASILTNHFRSRQPLKGHHAVVTAGPTFEPLDPVRFLGNRSSGKQGYAIAAALRDAGAKVTLISGPTHLTPPAHINVIPVDTANAMLEACLASLPADIFVGAAAVCDWSAETVADTKMKKGSSTPKLALKETPDILAKIAQHPSKRPELVIGFAAETASSENALITLAEAKQQRKGCDWIVANNVSHGNIFGDDSTSAILIGPEQPIHFHDRSKHDVARQLVAQAADHLSPSTPPLKVVSA